MDNHRVYGTKVDISSESIKNFYNRRVNKFGDDLTVVNLQQSQKLMLDRNDSEKKIFLPLFDLSRNKNVFELGCGIGRWAINIQSEVESYVGIDFSSQMVNIANKKFRNNPKINFQTMSVCEIDPCKLIVPPPYDLIICMGLLMYLNDNEVLSLFRAISGLITCGGKLFFKESISIMGERLTLNQIMSESLGDYYSAIYRTKEEYESLMESGLLESGFQVKENDLLLKDKLVNRKETSQMYWLLEKK